MSHYEFKFDPRSRILTSRTRGFWDTAIARRYFAELSQTIAKYRAQYGTIALLDDVREFEIQSKDVIQLFTELAGVEATKGQFRCAILTAQALQMIQSKRVFESDMMAMFSDEEEARAWLMKPVKSAA